MSVLKTTNYTYRLYEEGEYTSEGQTNTTGKYGLWFGIHRGTLMSRDEDGATFRYDTYQEAVEAFQRNAHHFAQFGYYIWHASIIAPDGTRHRLVDGAPYRR
jgi:hypothetical protein